MKKPRLVTDPVEIARLLGLTVVDVKDLRPLREDTFTRMLPKHPGWR